jgi:hypothetical protein
MGFAAAPAWSCMEGGCCMDPMNACSHDAAQSAAPRLCFYACSAPTFDTAQPALAANKHQQHQHSQPPRLNSKPSSLCLHQSKLDVERCYEACQGAPTHLATPLYTGVAMPPLCTVCAEHHLLRHAVIGLNLLLSGGRVPGAREWR